MLTTLGHMSSVQISSVFISAAYHNRELIASAILAPMGTLWVRSERGKYGLDHQRDDGFVVLWPLERPSGVFAGSRGTLARPDSGARTPELAKPRHNSG